jgi:hypothetical protein
MLHEPDPRHDDPPGPQPHGPDQFSRGATLAANLLVGCTVVLLLTALIVLMALR